MITRLTNKVKLPLSAALVILICLCFCGCTKKAAGSALSNVSSSQTSSVTVSSSSPRYLKYVTLTIDAIKGNDGIVARDKKVGIIKGETVYAVLKRYCTQNKILIAAQKTGNGMYVSSIDGVSQFDRGAQSGWLYSVGGVFSSKDCNSYKLSGGEEIKWIYTIDLGKSERAVK